MLYQNEFTNLKKIYDTLPEPQRETAKIISALPIGAMGVFGLVLVPLGIIGLGTVFLIGIFSTIAAALMIGACVPCGDARGIESFKAWAAVLSGRTEKAEDTEGFDTHPLQRAANDTGPAPVSLSKGKAAA